MGLSSDLKALKDVQRLKNGECVELSLSQLVNLLINLPDAKKKLSSDQFMQIRKLYNKFRSQNTKFELDADNYVPLAIGIINCFDCIAPYELYSGGNQEEFKVLMSEIREKEYEEAQKVRLEIEQSKKELFDWDASTDENNKVLKDSASDIELERMVEQGKLTEAQRTEYINKRMACQSFVDLAPSLRETIMKHIMELEAKLESINLLRKQKAEASIKEICNRNKKLQEQFKEYPATENRKYIDPKSTPLKFHKFTWYVTLPLGVLTTILNITANITLLSNVTGIMVPIALIDFLSSVLNLVLCVICIWGFRGWKSYSWYGIVAFFCYHIIYQIYYFGGYLYLRNLGVFISDIPSQIGAFVGILLYTIPALIYYKKRKKLFFIGNSDPKNNVFPNFYEKNQAKTIKREKYKNLLICLGVMLIISTLCNAYFINSYQKANNSIEENIKQIESLEKNMKDLEEQLKNKKVDLDTKNREVRRLKNEVRKLEEKADFLDAYIVIEGDDNTHLYHTYDCPYLDTSEGFWVYNSRAAGANGAKPCPYCQ